MFAFGRAATFQLSISGRYSDFADSVSPDVVPDRNQVIGVPLSNCQQNVAIVTDSCR
jgi:hypothetical protein